MFAYIIIGIELAILYFVFWVVFIREPKPREIRAELWGRYANDEERQSQEQQIKTPAFFYVDQEKLNSLLPSRVGVYSPAATFNRGHGSRRYKRRRRRGNAHSACSCFCHKGNSLNNETAYGVMDENDRIADRRFIERFFLLLNRTLNNLSVKVP